MNYKVVKIEDEKSVKLKLMATSKLLQTCYGKHENINQYTEANQYAKAVLKTPVNTYYNDVAVKVFPIKEYTA